MKRSSLKQNKISKDLTLNILIEFKYLSIILKKKLYLDVEIMIVVFEYISSYDIHLYDTSHRSHS